jgi:hypothetical protein
MVGLYRVSFRYGLNRARKELEAMLEAVQGSIRSQDIFGAPRPASPQLPRAGDGGPSGDPRGA